MDRGQILSLDLEITIDGKKLVHTGAVLGEQILDIRKNPVRAIQGLNDLARSASFVLGHNIGSHDLPWLTEQATDCSALKLLAVIDTLYLSPLAFPKNPYHRLVKDYKLIKDSVNNPVADARLALSIFDDQLKAFQQQYLQHPYLIELYQKLFEQTGIDAVPTAPNTVAMDATADFDTRGLAQVMKWVVKNPGNWTMKQLIVLCVKDKACPNQLQRLVNDFSAHRIVPFCLAYAVAWLQVAGGNSVLPAWVWRRFPAVRSLITRLRDTHCKQSDCRYCRKNFDARAYLQRFFEMDDFLTLPDGTPLQCEIVDAGINGEPLLGILPTGGGKSLCFQLPAMVRNLRSGSLTIVISPLQALMKDQVDGLKEKTGYEAGAAIHGMLTMPERSAVLESIRLGDISILYLSPEQLRNKTVKKALLSRQIGGWVFDEAHCLSKWGHDFRPDYLHCAKVIETMAEQQNDITPPIFCYTATAKIDVIGDICSHFKQQLNFTLRCFEGGVERENLRHEVRETQVHNKLAQILNLLEEYFSGDRPGCCVIYCSTRKKVEEVAQALGEAQQLPVCHYHAGLDASKKQATLEEFAAGKYRVVCATNAFGMGIDKEDVRLVIHHDIPGSLENYLQEAGRAGRDREVANCILLFDQQDIEHQFQLSSQSEIRLKDIRELLKEIRARARFTDGRLVTTSKELLRSDYTHTDISIDDTMADTKVKTAISWLEREGFLRREDNINSVFQGKPLFSNLQEADEKIQALQLSSTARQQWLIILQALMNTQADQGISADDILDSVIAQIKDQRNKRDMTPQRIMEILAQMASSGLISRGFSMTAYLQPKGRDNCRALFKAINTIELAMLELLPELAPDDSDNSTIHQVDIRALSSKLVNQQQLKSSPRIVRNILKGWSEDGRLSGETASITFTVSARELFAVKLNRSWSQIRRIATQRQIFTQKIVDFLYSQLRSGTESLRKKVMVDFTLEQGCEELEQDLLLQEQLAGKRFTERKDYLLKGMERALLFLDSHRVIELQNGMAVFKQAMEIIVPQDNKNRYSKSHYQLLDDHYSQKIVQVHVMNEYARLGMEHIKRAKALVSDYFSQANEEFIGRYFETRKGMLARATSQASWNRIVVEINNIHQQNIIHSKPNINQLVLAGPGAGKTKVIVHRVAYLMRVEQVPASKILVLSFSHNAAVSLHTKLVGLLGQSAHWIRVHTFHGLALHLLGQTFEPDQFQDRGFDSLISDAIKLLKGETLELGLDEYHQRSTVLDGIEHLLVDEYQDIDALQYAMIAALAGKNLEADDKLSLLAVGDDDQSIYQFRQANVKFIRQFRDDYAADIHYLTQNYRSTKHIIHASNSLIVNNQDRMKSAHGIAINDSRRSELAGGKWHALDPIHQGKVKRIQCGNSAQQANEVLRQIEIIKDIDDQVEYCDIAILARNGIDKEELVQVRSVLHQAQIPYSYQVVKEDGFALHGVKELVEFRQWLANHPSTTLDIKTILSWLPEVKNHWYQLIEILILDWKSRFGEQAIPAAHFSKQLNEYLIEQKRQTRYGTGVLLSTVHGVKGEEFKHVIVLDGGWSAGSSRNAESLAQQEEERRLYYVAMTRAVDQLVLCRISTMSNPHLAQLEASCCSDVVSNESDQVASLTRFYTTGLSQIYLSYAAKMAPQHPIHRRLQALQVGDTVEFANDKNANLSILNQGEKVAQLSSSGQEKILPLLPNMNKATVIALVRRMTNPESKYDASNETHEWWVPIIEVEVAG